MYRDLRKLDCVTTWGTSINYFRSRSPFYILILEEATRGNGGCIIDFRGSSEEHLPLAEFAYNNSFHSSILMTPYEALYVRSVKHHCVGLNLVKGKLGPKVV
ncbi:gag-pol [Gossypium australe]|uniref:Gag-pol n=1 Tax=Gossypium australe TaxID=47621 RepID=A0A5B6X0N1_9ROSI|nr:gag-pol [Gossypium australe]